MNKYIWLFLFLGVSFLTGCRQPEAVMTAMDGEKTASLEQTKSKLQTNGTNEDAQIPETGASGIESADKDSPGGQQEIYVYVCGHVKNPGVYHLPVDARICDALDLAGGVTKDGLPEALNQAEYMTDGQTLYVPGQNEEIQREALEEDGMVNINYADKAMLMTLPGIGESKADIIIQYREEHGAFESIEDLMDIPGIKEGVFNKIRGNIKCR